MNLSVNTLWSPPPSPCFSVTKQYECTIKVVLLQSKIDWFLMIIEFLVFLLSFCTQARSGNSRIGFGTDLQDKTAHDSILRLNDHELKLLDTLKKVIQHKIKSDRDYASALAGIGKLSAQFNAESSITHSSPLVKVKH